MMLIGCAVLGILFTVVIPKVMKLFEDTKATLPWTTRVLIGFTGFVTHWWWAILAVVAAAIWGFVRWKRTPDGKRPLAPVRPHASRSSAASSGSSRSAGSPGPSRRCSRAASRSSPRWTS